MMPLSTFPLRNLESACSTAKMVRRRQCKTDATAIFAALKPYVGRLHLVGHDVGGLSPWLHRELQALGLPLVLLETRHAAATLPAPRKKTDKNDARGLVQLACS